MTVRRVLARALRSAAERLDPKRGLDIHVSGSMPTLVLDTAKVRLATADYWRRQHLRG